MSGRSGRVMVRILGAALGVLAVVGAAPAGANDAAGTPGSSAVSDPAAGADAAPPGERDAAQRLADRIDELIAARWTADGLTPAAPSDDAEFFRRLSLDLSGRIPPGSEVRDFLADSSPDKRRRAIDMRLSSPTFIVHHTNLWRAALLPEADGDAEIRIFLPGFEAWLRSRIAENRSFAEITRELLTLPVEGRSILGFDDVGTATPAAFYRAKQVKPENLAAATARVFLGMRIECAQCHNHPFDHWKQNEFWSFAAFFAEFEGLRPDEGAAAMVAQLFTDKRSLKIPETDIVAPAMFLGGEQPQWDDGVGTRQRLAEWVLREDNPYFARAAANRTWAQLFGIGLVDPVDDLGTNNPPSHPELLDELARAFTANGSDFRFLIRAITLSQTYQLSSRRTHDSQDQPRSFARAPVRGLAPEQIFDSLAQATGYLQPFNPEEPLNFNNDAARQEFLETFANDSESTIERQATILQALTLMNGGFVADATDLADSQTLAAVVEAPFLSPEDRIEALFLATLSRPPGDEERDNFTEYVLSGGPKRDTKRALADVFWALLNSNEFLTNH